MVEVLGCIPGTAHTQNKQDLGSYLRDLSIYFLVNFKEFFVGTFEGKITDGKAGER